MKLALTIQLVLFSLIFVPLTYIKAQNPAYKIDSIKAFLFYNSNSSESEGNVGGKFSEDLVDNDKFALWNTIIGGGSAIGNSNQLMVFVIVKGNPKISTQRLLRLTAISGKKRVFQQDQMFSILDNAPNYTAGFLLYNTGCEKLQLKAEIISVQHANGKKIQKIESSLIKSIPFACGE